MCYKPRAFLPKPKPQCYTEHENQHQDFFYRKVNKNRAVGHQKKAKKKEKKKEP